MSSKVLVATTLWVLLVSIVEGDSKVEVPFNLDAAIRPTEQAMSRKLAVSLRLADGNTAKESHAIEFEIRSKGEQFSLLNPWMYQIGKDFKAVTVVVYDDQGKFVRYLDERSASKRLRPTPSLWTSLHGECYLGIKYRFPSWALKSGNPGRASLVTGMRRFSLQVLLLDRAISSPPSVGRDGKFSEASIARWKKFYRGEVIARSNVVEILVD